MMLVIVLEDASQVRLLRINIDVKVGIVSDIPISLVPVLDFVATAEAVVDIIIWMGHIKCAFEFGEFIVLLERYIIGIVG